MRGKLNGKAALFILAAVIIASLSFFSCVAPTGSGKTLFITGTYGALHRGAYDSTVTIRDIKQQGDLALGNFSSLDGELMGLDGKYYQIGAQGKLIPADDSWTTPNCTATFFKPDKAVSIEKPLDYEELRGFLDNQLPTPNYFYAMKVTGKFDWIKARTLTRINKPYPTTAYSIITQNEPTFEFRNVDSTLVIVVGPGHMGEICYPGYHIHCINSDGKYGGHVLDCRMTGGRAEIASLPNFTVNLPQNDEFLKADFSQPVFTVQPDDQQLLKTAVGQMQKMVQARLDQMDSDTSKAAGSLSTLPLNGTEAQRVLNDLYSKHPDIIDTALTDAKGTMIKFAPDKFSSYEGTYIGDKEDTKKFNQARKPVLSSMFKSVEGIDAVVIVWPVFSDSGEFKGSLSVLFRPDALFGSQLSQAARQSRMELNIMQTDGLILYSPDSAEISKNLFTDPMYQSATDLLALGRNMVAQESGTGPYTFPGTVKKLTAWASAGLHGTSWRLIAIKQAGQ